MYVLECYRSVKYLSATWQNKCAVNISAKHKTLPMQFNSYKIHYLAACEKMKKQHLFFQLIVNYVYQRGKEGTIICFPNMQEM